MTKRGLPPKITFLPQKLGIIKENTYRNRFLSHIRYVNELKCFSIYDVNSEDPYNYLSTATNGNNNLRD